MNSRCTDRAKRILYLPLKAEYFDAIKAGTKKMEYRLITPYWSKRLGGIFAEIVLTKGYPKRGDRARRLRRPWKGYCCTVIQHPHFGRKPVSVYAIQVN